MRSDHYLKFLENEDEAQMTGYKFSVDGDQVIVSQTFHFPEYEEFDEPRLMTRNEARTLWSKLIVSGKFETFLHESYLPNAYLGD